LDRGVPPRLLSRAFVLTCASTFGALAAIGMLFPVLPLYAEGPLGAGTVGVGVVVAATAPTALLLQPLGGRVGDRIGRRPLMVAGALTLGASIALYGLADSLPTLVALRLVTGVGEGLVFVASATTVNDLAPPGRRGEAVSIYSLSTWGGLAVGPLVGDAVLDAAGFGTVWLVAAASGVAASAVALAIPETRPRVEMSAMPWRVSTLVHRAAVRPGLILVLAMVGFAGMVAFAPLYAKELGLSGVGALFFLNAVIVLTVRIAGRRIPDVVGPKRTATAAVTLSAAGLGVIAAWQAPAGLYAGTVVLALGQALVFPALMMLVVSAAPENQRSAAVGSFTAFAELGYAAGAIALGAVAHVAGYATVFGLAATLVLAGLLPLRGVRGGPPVAAPAAADAPP
jgi:MFS family permease